MAEDTSGLPVFISDLGSVLIGIDYTDFFKALREATVLDDTEFTRSFGLQVENEYRLFETGQLSEEEFFSQFHSRLRLDRIRKEDLSVLWNAIFTPISEMLELMMALSRLGRLRMVALSNTNVTHFTYCRARFPQLEAFDGFILSYEEGTMKPDLAIYESVKNRYPDARDFFYVDDIPDYVAAASHVGIWGVVYRGFSDFLEQAERDQVFGPVFREAARLIPRKEIQESVERQDGGNNR